MIKTKHQTPPLRSGISFEKSISEVEAVVDKFTKDTFRNFREDEFRKLNDLIDRKNNDYTAGGSCFSNFEICEEIGIDRLRGLTIRVLDKIQRLKSFAKSGALEVKNESVEDIFKDLIGYSFIALAMINEDRSKK